MLELIGQAEIVEILKRIVVLVGLNVLLSALIVVFAFLNILKFRVNDERGRNVLRFSLSKVGNIVVVLPATIIVMIVLWLFYVTIQIP